MGNAVLTALWNVDCPLGDDANGDEDARLRDVEFSGDCGDAGRTATEEREVVIPALVERFMVLDTIRDREEGAGGDVVVRRGDAGRCVRMVEPFEDGEPGLLAGA